MKKIKPLHDFTMPGQGFTKDEEVAVHDDTAELLVGRGHAVLVEPPQPPPLPADRGQEH